jgi:hypothetical protein
VCSRTNSGVARRTADTPATAASRGVAAERGGDGPHLAAELGRGGRRSRRGLGEDDDLPGCPVLGQDVGDPPDVGVQFGSHGPDSTATALAA